MLCSGCARYLESRPASFINTQLFSPQDCPSGNGFHKHYGRGNLQGFLIELVSIVVSILTHCPTGSSTFSRCCSLQGHGGAHAPSVEAVALIKGRLFNREVTHIQLSKHCTQCISDPDQTGFKIFILVLYSLYLVTFYYLTNSVNICTVSKVLTTDSVGSGISLYASYELHLGRRLYFINNFCLYNLG